MKRGLQVKRILMVGLLAMLLAGCGTKKQFAIDSNPRGALIVGSSRSGFGTTANGQYLFSEAPLGETPKDVTVNFSEDTDTVQVSIEKRGYEVASSVLDLNSTSNFSVDLKRITGVSEKVFTKEELASGTYAMLQPFVEVHIHSGVGRLDKTEYSAPASQMITEGMTNEVAKVVNGTNKQLSRAVLDETLLKDWREMSAELNAYLLKLNENRLAYYSLPPLVNAQVKGFQPFLEKLAQQGNTAPHLVYVWNKCVSETTGRKVGNVMLAILGGVAQGGGAAMGMAFYYDPTAFNPDSGTLTVVFVIDAKTSEVVHMERRVYPDIMHEAALKRVATILGKFPQGEEKEE